jgi:hypothetical protein
VIRRTPLKRSQKPIARTPVKKKRSTLRRGKATAEEKAVVRLAVYERSGGLCELRLGSECYKGILPFEGSTPWDHGHLVHMKSEGSGGSTDEANCYWGCPWCHLHGLHVQGGKGKIVPSKNQERN